MTDLNDLYIDRPDVPGHAMHLDTVGRNFVVVCECKWRSEPLHLSNTVAARNKHRVEVGGDV